MENNRKRSFKREIKKTVILLDMQYTNHKMVLDNDKRLEAEETLEYPLR